MARRDYENDPDAPKANSLVPAASAVVVDGTGRVLLQRRRDNAMRAGACPPPGRGRRAVRTPQAPAQSPSAVNPSSSIALPRTIRSTTSGARWPIWDSPTSRDFGQVESEWG